MTEQQPTAQPGLGERIKAARTKAGLTEKAAADLAVIAQPYLHQIEAGIRNPSPDTLLRLAGALDVTVGDLFGS